MGPTGSKIFLGIFFGIFLVVGIGVSILGVQTTQKSIASDNWPQTQGTIITSDIETHKTHTKHGYSYTYGPEIVYTYSVNGQSYTANKVSYSTGSSSDVSYAQKIVNTYPVGTQIPVFYNPENPTEAVLEPGSNTMTYFPIIFGIVFIAVGIGGIIYIIRSN